MDLPWFLLEIKWHHYQEDFEEEFCLICNNIAIKNFKIKGSLINKISVVTGASSGIGKAFVEKLARSEYKVYAISKNGVHFQDCLERWQNESKIIPLIGNIKDEKNITEIFENIKGNEKN